MEKRLHPRAHGKKLSEIVNDAIILSADWRDKYLDRHTYVVKKITPEVTVQLALARYEWLLSTARNSILSNFSDDELYLVAISLQSELAIPNDYPLARAVADDNFILWKDYQQSQYATLINKLISLTPLEDMAIRDILEPFWYRPQEQGKWFPEYISKERSSLLNDDSPW